MSQQRLYEFVTGLLPSWRKTRRRVLALGVQGLMRKRRLTLSAVARGMDSRCRIIHRVKRLWRFLDNPAVDPRQATCALAQAAFARRGGKWVPVVMDETGVKDRATLLAAAVPYRGRALPLAMYAYAPQLLKKSLWAIREGLLSVIRDALPPEQRSRLLLIGDRGYAASHFFARLLKAQVAFVIRVPRKVLVHMACGSHCLETLAADLEPGQWRLLRGVHYGPLRARLNVVLWWQADQPEPWILATTLQSAKEARDYYRLRMGIEELFKDLKGRFELEACQLQTLNRITRACLLVALALWALALLVRYCAGWVRFITARGALSFLSLALEWLDATPSQRRTLRAEAESG
jgi:hypothetical protein